MTLSSADAEALIVRAKALRIQGQLIAAEKLLRQAAATGHIEAIAELGQQLFLSPPPAPEFLLEEGVKHVFAAANAGHAMSANLASLIAAHDPTIPGHWQCALDFAARAAVAGFIPAQFALAFLSADREAIMRLSHRETLGPEIWQKLRERVDVPALLSAPYNLRVLCTSPYIVMAEEFISPAMCDWIMRRARPALKKGKGYVPEPGKPVRRTNSEVEYGFPELDLIQTAVRHRIAEVTGMPHGGLEPPSVFHYAPGEEFTAHHDYLNTDIPVLAAEIARTGQCVFTALVYLNDDFSAGETNFVDIGIKAKGKKGDAIIFRNVDEKGVPDPRTRHAGLPPTHGNKWLFSQFVRNTKQAHKLPG